MLPNRKNQNPKKNVAIPKKNVANPKKNVANPKENVAISIGNILVCRQIFSTISIKISIEISKSRIFKTF